MGGERVLNRVFVLVTWDENSLHGVQRFLDEHEAIETLKDNSPFRKSHLYVCDEMGGVSRVQGW